MTISELASVASDDLEPGDGDDEGDDDRDSGDTLIKGFSPTSTRVSILCLTLPQVIYHPSSWNTITRIIILTTLSLKSYENSCRTRTFYHRVKSK